MSKEKKQKPDYESAASCLDELFESAEQDYQEGRQPVLSDAIREAAAILFESPTQSYREVLLGCGLIRLMNKQVNIRFPYSSQDPTAFNGRSLDEKVVNPFFHEHMIPSSKGPYLASFRRSVKFVPETEKGLRDKIGYRALLRYLEAFENTSDDSEIRDLLVFLLLHFISLREKAAIPLSRVARFSLDQYEILIEKLLHTPSGGLFPVLLTVAMFRTVQKAFALPWEVEWQGINVADKASGAAGDITIKESGSILLSVEVTERVIDKARVVSTFNTKIIPCGIRDYIFFSSGEVDNEEVKSAAMHYFAQGHDVNFLQVKPWIINLLG
ncbi:MAG TPA: restriction endonuclease, SacI family, partial [Deltaproteobacteria bacterium]|nr:restriction endonuclease, SacI family [Deltaproteobacteria bacterium]